MKIDKVDVSMTAVGVIHKVLRDFGAVCQNCEHMSNEEHGIGYCDLFLREMDSEGFCSMFRFRDDKSCEELFRRISNYEIGE